MSTVSISVRSLREIWASAENVHTARPLLLGIPEIDSALGGGVACGKISEVYGGPGAGKTQLALTIVAQVCVL